MVTLALVRWLLLGFVVLKLCGWLAYYLADKKHRPRPRWLAFGLGFLLGPVGVLLLLLLPGIRAPRGYAADGTLGLDTTRCDYVGDAPCHRRALWELWPATATGLNGQPVPGTPRYLRCNRHATAAALPPLPDASASATASSGVMTTGTLVFTHDGERLGVVTALRGPYFQVTARLWSAYWFQRSIVVQETAARVTLECSKQDVHRYQVKDIDAALQLPL